jgi:hypothetical protein
MTDTTGLRGRGEEQARRTNEVLAQSAALWERTVRTMEWAADVEDELAAVADRLAAQQPRAEERLRVLGSKAKQQADRYRQWVQEHRAQAVHRIPEIHDGVPLDPAVRGQRADVLEALARTHDEAAALQQKIARRWPQTSRLTTEWGEEARRRAEIYRRWARDLSTQPARPAPSL